MVMMMWVGVLLRLEAMGVGVVVGRCIVLVKKDFGVCFRHFRHGWLLR